LHPCGEILCHEPLEIEKFRKATTSYPHQAQSYATGRVFHVRRIVDGLMYIVVVIAGALFLRDGAINAGRLCGRTCCSCLRFGVHPPDVEFTSSSKTG
jgi:hypothetical protein